MGLPRRPGSCSTTRRTAQSSKKRQRHRQKDQLQGFGENIWRDGDNKCSLDDKKRRKEAFKEKQKALHSSCIGGHRTAGPTFSSQTTHPTITPSSKPTASVGERTPSTWSSDKSSKAASPTKSSQCLHTTDKPSARYPSYASAAGLLELQTDGTCG